MDTAPLSFEVKLGGIHVYLTVAYSAVRRWETIHGGRLERKQIENLAGRDALAELQRQGALPGERWIVFVDHIIAAKRHESADPHPP